jgi:hypothetical protein
VFGDIRQYLAAGNALRDLVHESNKADHTWFVDDLHALDDRLRAAQPA